MKDFKTSASARLARACFIFCLLAAPCLHPQVPQKIAVLEFTAEGTAPGFEFVTRSIPGTIEIDLDRTGNLYVIRRYLWETVYAPDQPVSDLKSALRFGLGARIDGVVFGRVKFGKKDADITVKICDVLKGVVIMTNRFTLPLDETFFRKSEAATGPIVRAVTNAFPPKERETIIRERKEIKKVYADIKGRSSEVRVRAGYMFSDLRFNTASGSTNNLTNSVIYRPASGIVIEALFKWRMLETAAGFEISPLSDGTLATARIKAGVWLVREMMQLSCQAWVLRYSSSRLRGSSVSIVPGIVFKPGDDFSFGMDIGPTITSMFDNTLFDSAGWQSQKEKNMAFGIFYRMSLWRRLETELRIGMSEISRYYSRPGGQNAEQKIGNNYIQILLSYRLGKE
jgi:TolB-like protein